MRKGYLKTYVKILLIIIVLIVVIYGIGCVFKSGYDIEQFETIKTDMLLIEAKTKIIAEKVKIKEKDIEYVGKKIEEIKEDEDIKKLQEQGIVNIEEKKNTYYILEKNHLEELGLTTMDIKEGRYIVEYNTNEIIYTKGVKDKEKNVLYKLSDIKNN